MRETNELKKIQDQSLGEKVVDVIRRAIRAGELPEGIHLSEEELASSLGVSRSPVREALKQLAQEGLVVTQRNRGTFVRAYNSQDIEEVFLLRSGLESLGMEYAMLHLTEEEFGELEKCIQEANVAINNKDLESLEVWDERFHHYIMRKAGLPQVFAMWQVVSAQCWTLNSKRFRSSPDDVPTTVAIDHAMILNAMRSKDVGKIYEVNRSINSRVANDLKRLLV